MASDRDATNAYYRRYYAEHRERILTRRGTFGRPKGPTPTDPSVRFWRKVDTSGDCWIWRGATGPTGYGRFSVRRGETPIPAHRFAYEDRVGPIPDDHQIDHLCRVRNCVNPAHLEPVSPRENTLRGDTVSARNARKTECVNGHPFTGEWRGRRLCSTCRRDANARLSAKRKAARQAAKGTR